MGTGHRSGLCSVAQHQDSEMVERRFLQVETRLVGFLLDTYKPWWLDVKRERGEECI